MMATTIRFDRHAAPRLQPAAAVVRAAIVGLALCTAAIHLTLGGTLFTLNAIGYAALAIALVLPGLGRVRWLVRFALLGFTVATIGGWLLFGARFPLAYVDKAVELVLVAFLLAEMLMLGGGRASNLRAGRATISTPTSDVRRGPR